MKIFNSSHELSEYFLVILNSISDYQWRITAHKKNSPSHTLGWATDYAPEAAKFWLQTPKPRNPWYNKRRRFLNTLRDQLLTRLEWVQIIDDSSHKSIQVIPLIFTESDHLHVYWAKRSSTALFRLFIMDEHRHGLYFNEIAEFSRMRPGLIDKEELIEARKG